MVKELVLSTNAKAHGFESHHVYMVDKPQNYLAQQCANFIYEIKINKTNLIYFYFILLFKIIIHIRII